MTCRDGERTRGGVLRGPTINPLDPATAGSSPVVYSGWLPPGRYRLQAFETPGGVYAAGVEFDVEGAFPEFAVEAGRLTDLGTLLEQPVGAAVSTLVQWNEPPAFDPEAYERLPEVKLLDAAPIRWDAAPRSSPELVAAIKQATIGLTAPAFDSDGNAYFGSNLGQVLLRSPEGEWRNLDTLIVDEIAGVDVDGSRIEVATAQGRLLTSTDGGATWSTAPTRLEGRVTSMVRFRGELVVATAGTPDMDAMVFRGASLQSLAPDPWKRLELGRRMRRFPSRRAMLAVAGDRLIAWVHYKASFVYDGVTGEWTDAEAPFDLGELLANGPAGLLYSAGPFKNAALSADGGRTWTRMAYSETPVGAGFRDATHGMAIVAEGNLLGLGAARHYVETTADGGKTWTRVGAPPSACRAARYLPPTGELVCVGPDGAIRTTENGIDWTAERTGYR